MAKYRVEFIEDAQVEHAHTGSNAGKGGYHVEKIKKGTIVEDMRAASVNFWTVRGKIKVLGRVEEPALSAFGAVVRTQEPGEVQPMPKATLRGVMEAAHRALDRGEDGAKDLEELLAGLDLQAIAAPLEPLPEDAHMLLWGAIEDAKSGGPIANLNELGEALLDAADVLLAPSKRKRVKPSAPE